MFNGYAADEFLVATGVSGAISFQSPTHHEHDGLGWRPRLKNGSRPGCPGAYPNQVSAALYRSLADKLKTAGDVPGAIEILTAGGQRFPAEHASFADAIGAFKDAAPLDPAQVQRLKALGYL